jgi:hypothetical protein
LLQQVVSGFDLDTANWKRRTPAPSRAIKPVRVQPIIMLGAALLIGWGAIAVAMITLL